MSSKVPKLGHSFVSTPLVDEVSQEFVQWENGGSSCSFESRDVARAGFE